MNLPTFIHFYLCGMAAAIIADAGFAIGSFGWWIYYVIVVVSFLLGKLSARKDGKHEILILRHDFPYLFLNHFFQRSVISAAASPQRPFAYQILYLSGKIVDNQCLGFSFYALNNFFILDINGDLENMLHSLVPLNHFLEIFHQALRYLNHRY